jgi:hypothetical protein
MKYLKDDSAFLTVELPAERVATVAPRASEETAGATHVFNRLGRIIAKLSARHQVDPASVIAVWVAQTGGRLFAQRRAQLHFEVHKFFESWGHHHRQEFDDFFRFGGHNMQLGQPWENHEYRADVGMAFCAVHHNQNSEYASVTLARMLAGDEKALQAASLGGCLLSVSAYSFAGYDSPIQMFTAFQESERAHVLAFFDYCSMKGSPKMGDLFRYLKTRDWTLFARHYPVANQTPLDPERLRVAYAAAQEVLGQS